MSTPLLVPPIAFVVALAAALALSWGLKGLALKPKVVPAGLKRPYACGEDVVGHMIQPDYGQFLPFAVFFTVLHVVALIVATVPVQTPATFVIAVVYLLGAMVGLSVLYGK